MKDRVEYIRNQKVPGLVLGEAHLSTFSFERHFHLDYHIGLVTEGVQRQRYHGESLLLTPGTIQLMPPDEIHDGICADDGFYTLKTFRASTELLADIVRDISGREGLPSLGGAVLLDHSLSCHLSHLHTVMREGHDFDSLAVQTGWLTLLDQLLLRSGLMKSQPFTGRLSPQQRRLIREYCESRLAEKITLEDLAELCGLERYQFLKYFKQTVGMTPHAWLVRLRLERACLLLARNEWQVSRIAQEVGFYDHSHFTRAFRQAFGVAPSHY
ncbi:AraC family transcriptional regulator [Pseudomonas sp. NPDC089392]|uniref:helix-turn-helix transcriptional regulator n=1 Tax=Pseudomonas sp. NPDC089392 TaxID=3364459 RepID=UPI00382F242F